MEWKVFVENFNGRKIEPYNIFNHYSFKNDVKDAYKKYKDDFEAFSEEVRTSLHYYFWSHTEWEIIMSDWPPSKKEPIEVKVDVYAQVMMNWNKFIKYTWDMCHARKNAKEVNLDFTDI